MSFSRREFVGAASLASLAAASRIDAQGTAADLVLFNGRIVTVDDAFSIRQAIVVKDGKIEAIGPSARVKAPAGIGSVQTLSNRHITVGLDGIVEMSKEDAACWIAAGWIKLPDGAATT